MWYAFKQNDLSIQILPIFFRENHHELSILPLNKKLLKK
jgi:hypothetical protein